MIQNSVLNSVKAKIKSPVITNILWLSFDRVFKLLIGLIVGIWVARYLGPEQWGKLNYVSAFITILTTIAKLGMDSFLSKEILQNPEAKNEILGTSFVIRAFLVPLLFFFVAGYFYFEELPQEYYWQLAFQFLGVIVIPFDLIDLDFQSRLQSKLTITSKNIAYVLAAVVRLYFVFAQKPLLWFAAVMGLEVVLAYIFLLFFYQRNDNILDWRFSKKRAINLISVGWPFTLTSLAIILYIRLDQIMLGAMAGEKELGLFSSAARISDIFLFLPTAVAGSFLPSLVAAKNEGPEYFMQRIQFLMNWMMRISLFVALSITLFSNQIISLLFGADFVSGGNILVIHIWSLVPSFVGVATAQYLVLENLQKFSLYRTLMGLATNLALNLYLIPRYGAIGAALATTISQSIAAIFSGPFFGPTRMLFVMQLKSLRMLFDFTPIKPKGN